MKYFFLPSFSALAIFASFWLFSSSPVFAAVPSPTYDIGTTTLRDIWVDPTNGNDANDGTARNRALRSVSAAWNLVPMTRPLSGTGYRILLMRGTYPESILPTEGTFFERHGTKQFPIILQGIDGPQTAIFTRPLNIQDVRYFYLIDLDIRAPISGGNTLQMANAKNILLRNVRIIGAPDTDQVFKGNQIQYAYLENIEVEGGTLGLDFVAAQYGHIVNSRFHGSGEWCLYLKGGTAYFRVEGNEIYDCRSAGAVSLGNGTGFDYMVSPWLHYEAEDIKFVNNTIWNSVGSGIGVFGGYNILVSHNTVYNSGTGSIGYGLVTVGFGERSCDGDTVYAPGMCATNNRLGGWGPSAPIGGNAGWIPNKNVAIYNNVFYNKNPRKTVYSHFVIEGPRTPPNNTNLSGTVHADTGLSIRGNVIWNGGTDMTFGIEEGSGCQSTNPACNQTQILRENTIHTIEPQFVNPDAHDFHLTPSSNLLTARTYPLPTFSWADAPTTPAPPVGTLVNSVRQDKDGKTREAIIVGAYVSANAPSPIPPPPSPPPAPSPSTTGALVKLVCPPISVPADHPCKAVYYVSSRNQRHAFPNEKVYFTWYQNFSSVQEISHTVLASIPLGKNVTYRPGVRLVKFRTSPRVYAVARGALLRWVMTENIVQSLYGTDWNRQTDDIEDTFYPDYRFGTDITDPSQYDPRQEQEAVTTIDQNG